MANPLANLWGVPELPELRERPILPDREPHRQAGWAATWRASRRAPGPRLARHRSWWSRLAAARCMRAGGGWRRSRAVMLVVGRQRGCEVSGAVAGTVVAHDTVEVGDPVSGEPDLGPGQERRRGGAPL